MELVLNAKFITTACNVRANKICWEIHLFAAQRHLKNVMQTANVMTQTDIALLNVKLLAIVHAVKYVRKEFVVINATNANVLQGRSAKMQEKAKSVLKDAKRTQTAPRKWCVPMENAKMLVTMLNAEQMQLVELLIIKVDIPCSSRYSF